MSELQQLLQMIRRSIGREGGSELARMRGGPIDLRSRIQASAAGCARSIRMQEWLGLGKHESGDDEQDPVASVAEKSGTRSHRRKQTMHNNDRAEPPAVSCK